MIWLVNEDDVSAREEREAKAAGGSDDEDEVSLYSTHET